MFASINGYVFNLQHVVRVNHIVDVAFVMTTDGKYTTINCDESQYQSFLNKLKDYNLYLQQEKREYKAHINLL